MQSDPGRQSIISSDGGIASPITPFQTIVNLAPFILAPTGTITKGGKTIPSNDSGPCQMPLGNSITPPSPWLSIEPELSSHEEGEEDIQGPKDEPLRWKRQDDQAPTT